MVNKWVGLNKDYFTHNKLIVGMCIDDVERRFGSRPLLHFQDERMRGVHLREKYQDLRGCNDSRFPLLFHLTEPFISHASDVI